MGDLLDFLLGVPERGQDKLVIEPPPLAKPGQVRKMLGLDPTEHETDLLMSAWGVIANVSNGDWTQQTAEWQEAASIWRANFHMTLDALTVRKTEL